MDLDAFRAAYPARTLAHAGIEWEYIRGGHGGRTLLILPGALGVAEASWSTIARYAETGSGPAFDVLAVTYPAEVDTMDRLADGITALLDHLEVPEVCLFGASYGGIVGQVLARRHPNRVTRAVFSHTGAANPGRVNRVQRAMRLWRRLPVPILKSMYRRQFSRSYREIDAPAGEELTRYMEEVVSKRMTRDSIVNTFLRIVDFDQNWDQQPNTPYPGPVLLLFGEMDPATPPSERERLKEMYPQAEVTVFAGSGHATAVLEADAFFDRVEQFLAEEIGPAHSQKTA